MNDLSEADYIELETTVFELLNEELNEYSLQYASKSFYQNLVYDLSDLLLSHWYEDHDEDDVHYFMYMIIMSFFQVFLEFPHRSYVEYCLSCLASLDVRLLSLQYFSENASNFLIFNVLLSLFHESALFDRLSCSNKAFISISFCVSIVCIYY